MKISARNTLKGKIVKVEKGTTTAHVTIDIGGGAIVTASITNAAVDDLKLADRQGGLRRDQGVRRHGSGRLRRTSGKRDALIAVFYGPHRFRRADVNPRHAWEVTASETS